MYYTEANVPLEVDLAGSGARRSLPDVAVDVHVSGPQGFSARVPAFWRGGNRFGARIAAPHPGRYRYRTSSTDPDDPGLHGVAGEIEVLPYSGENPLYRHGRLRVSRSRRHLEHDDGTPFFWLGDTWWMGLCRRMGWPGDFKSLTEDRVRKGFSVIQIIAGLYPDMPAFDERGANEAGFPWDRSYAELNPSYFDMADQRIGWLVERGLVPCVVGSWGYFLPWMGVPALTAHWRNLVARWGAYPVVWCLAGEGAMPYYLSPTKEKDVAEQKEGWTRIGRAVREMDPWHNPVTIHPTESARDQILDPSVIDFEMLQTGHGDRKSLARTLRAVGTAWTREPRMPVINAEVCYEGIGEACRQEVQRLMFWACLLNGTAGHSYGANGIWQVNTRERPYGASPSGRSWGNTRWDEAAALPGSGNLGVARRVLERFEWWRFEPHPEWVEPHFSPDAWDAPYAAGIPGEVRIIYIPLGETPTVCALERGRSYRATLVNPCDGSEVPLGEIAGDAKGEWPIDAGTPERRLMPIYQDWLLLLVATGA